MNEALMLTRVGCLDALELGACERSNPGGGKKKAVLGGSSRDEDGACGRCMSTGQKHRG